MCEADVTAILTDTGLDGIVTPLGAVHQNRYPTANERRALAIRDQGCVYPRAVVRRSSGPRPTTSTTGTSTNAPSSGSSGGGAIPRLR